VLTTASALGTLAAARCLGEHGVRVVVLDAHRFAPAAWSRYVRRYERAPTVRPIGPFLDALLDFGERNPGHVLYATSDDLAWMFAEHETELKRSFRLLTPPFDCIARVLDKRDLYAACEELGIAVPETLFPESEPEVDRAGARLRFPVIIKPRAQVFFESARKGVIVRSASALTAAYRAFASGNRFEPTITSRRPSIARPMIQELHTAEPIFSVSGFCDPRKGLFVARGGRKVVQWPRQAGVGMVFEDAPLDVSLADDVRRLCAATGFFGVFEAEFVQGGGTMRLIDFNPRLFHQVGFDVARGLPSPYLVHLLALGETERLEAAVEAARNWRSSRPLVFLHRSSLALTRLAERIAGRAPERVPESLRGARFCASDALVVEAARDAYDWVPGVVEGLRQVGHVLQHPRSTLRAAARGYAW
jgi:predicted ATP-grasp superfamily ATP-dependent carboligase